MQSIIRNLIQVNSGEPWFGRAVYTILDEIDPAIVHQKPNENSHSLLQLLYHMITWAEFTLKSIEKSGKEDINAIEQKDWREIDPTIHSWQKGLAEFKNINEKANKTKLFLNIKNFSLNSLHFRFFANFR